MWADPDRDKNRALSHLLLLSFYKEETAVRPLPKIDSMQIVICDTNI